MADIFMVSNTSHSLLICRTFHIRGLVAGDDAEFGTACRVKLSFLSREDMGIPDHFDMIVAAIPECFAAEANPFTESRRRAWILKMPGLPRLLCRAYFDDIKLIPTHNGFPGMCVALTQKFIGLSAPSTKVKKMHVRGVLYLVEFGQPVSLPTGWKP